VQISAQITGSATSAVNASSTSSSLKSEKSELDVLQSISALSDDPVPHKYAITSQLWCASMFKHGTFVASVVR
jgi:hypothetical protein